METISVRDTKTDRFKTRDFDTLKSELADQKTHREMKMKRNRDPEE